MMRTKRRYILTEVANLPGESFEQFEGGFYEALAAELGAMEYHRANPKIIRFMGKRFILRVTLEKYSESVTALALIKRVNGADMAFYTAGASGTIRALMKNTTN